MEKKLIKKTSDRPWIILFDDVINRIWKLSDINDFNLI